jgi:phage shock protein C
MTATPRLTRSQDDRMMAGVCGGIARHMGWNANRFRVVWLILSIFSAAFPGIIVYLAAWFLIPDERSPV